MFCQGPDRFGGDPEDQGVDAGGGEAVREGVRPPGLLHAMKQEKTTSQPRHFAQKTLQLTTTMLKRTMCYRV